MHFAGVSYNSVQLIYITVLRKVAQSIMPLTALLDSPLLATEFCGRPKFLLRRYREVTACFQILTTPLLNSDATVWYYTLQPELLSCHCINNKHWTTLSVRRTAAYTCVSQTFLPAEPFRLRKLTTDPHSLADVNIVCTDDRDPKLTLYIPELILDRYEWRPVAYVTTYCMILP